MRIEPAVSPLMEFTVSRSRYSVFDDLIAIVKELLALLRGRDGILRAIQKGKTEFILQRIEHVADARLGISKLLCRFCDVAKLDYLYISQIFYNIYPFPPFCFRWIIISNSNSSYTKGIKNRIVPTKKHNFSV